jgi:hypothetical protein
MYERKQTIFRKTSSKVSDREENRFINNIVQYEIALPDEVLVSNLFNDFKLLEFLSALFALIGKIKTNLAIFSGIYYFETKTNPIFHPKNYTKTGIANGLFASVIVMNVANFFFCKHKVINA